MSDNNYKILEIINNNELQDATSKIWSLLNDVFTEDSNNLTKYELNVYLIEMFIMEVHSGGFQSFFEESYGDYTNETLTALIDVKSIKFKDLFEKAISEFPDSNVPKDMFERRLIKEKISVKAQEVWDKLDLECYKYEENIDELVINYIKSNMQYFR